MNPTSTKRSTKMTTLGAKIPRHAYIQKKTPDILGSLLFASNGADYRT